MARIVNDLGAGDQSEISIGILTKSLWIAYAFLTCNA